MKTHAQIPKSSFRTIRQLGWLLLLPVLTLPLTAQTNGPEMDIERVAAVISWPVSATNYILLSSANTNGPWYPCLDPIARGPGVLQTAVRTTDHSQEFGLAEGEWFMDDFEDGLSSEWGLLRLDDDFGSLVSIDSIDGRVRVHGNCGSCPQRKVVFYHEDLLAADVSASIDILDWDESGGYEQNIGLFARIESSLVTTNSMFYIGGVSPVYRDDPTKSVLWLGFNSGGSYATFERNSIVKMQSSEDYRLVFHLVGTTGTVELYNLADSDHPLATFTWPLGGGTTLPDGRVGFLVAENAIQGGGLDVTLDNFLAVGTTP